MRPCKLCAAGPSRSMPAPCSKNSTAQQPCSRGSHRRAPLPASPGGRPPPPAPARLQPGGQRKQDKHVNKACLEQQGQCEREQRRQHHRQQHRRQQHRRRWQHHHPAARKLQSANQHPAPAAPPPSSGGGGGSRPHHRPPAGPGRGRGPGCAGPWKSVRLCAQCPPGKRGSPWGPAGRRRRIKHSRRRTEARVLARWPLDPTGLMLDAVPAA